MNCHDIEGIVNDLARGQMMEASLREKALAHTASCGGCMRRLDDERALTAGLRAVAGATGTEQASPSVESALLMAFRDQHSSKVAPVFVPARRSPRSWVYAAVGVAAVVAIVMLLTLSAWKSSVSQPGGPEKENAAAPVVPPSSEDRLANTGPQRPSVEPYQKPTAVKTPTQVKSASRRVKPAVQSNPTASKPDDSMDEIATDFIPLINRDSLTQLDGGQVMRVELPRSALVSFGLPMDMERANERIKADVIVGDDGLARAIRFVR